MRPQPAMKRLWLLSPSTMATSRCIKMRSLQQQFPQAQRAHMSTRSRPTIQFLASSSAKAPPNSRSYASQNVKQYLSHQGKLFIRYAFIFGGVNICGFIIYYMILEEMRERDYPTPHEWKWRDRKLFRDANKWTNPELTKVSWAWAYQLARNLCLTFEDPKQGYDLVRLSDNDDINAEVSWEFVPHDISHKSEEFRRGYFQTMMLTAKAAGLIDGWLKETNGKSKKVWPPHYVIGPSNPRPRPIPPGEPPAPREEDCELAFPPADRYYLKILATKGFSPRQKLEAALDYARFIETKRNPSDAEALYNLALAQATRGLAPNELAYNPKNLVIKDRGPPPSENILDAITAYANHKARTGKTSEALPIYVSLLKSRRALSDSPPRVASQLRPKTKHPWYRKLLPFPEPEYPPPPADGTQPPWRSPEERCQEASLNLYIGEIMYTSSSREDGVAWTREGVDIAEQELRELSLKPTPSTAKERCRECLRTGLDNWSLMVARLARDEQLKTEKSKLSFWGSGSNVSAETKGRWDAENAVVEERTKRTIDIVEDVKPAPDGIMKFLKA